MTPSMHITGIELNPYFTDIQNKIISKYSMQNRVQIVMANVMSTTGQNLLLNSDIILMNNVFQFFQGDNDVVKRVWQFIKDNFRGSIIVSVPDLTDILTSIDSEIVVSEWVSEFTPVASVDEMDDEELEGVENIHFYRLL